MSAPDLVAIGATRGRLWDAGYRPLAVYSHDHSDRDRAGKAPLGAAWTERARRNPPEAITLPAVAHAANTGLLCDGLRVIDVDVDEAEPAGHVRACIIAMFGDDVPIRYRENSSRCAALLRAASGSPGKRVLAGRLGKIEVLGHGQQLVSHGIHPSGTELYWYPESPEQVARDVLRAITEDEITAFLDAVAPLIEAEPEPRRNSTHISPADGPATAEIFNIIAALTFIPNDGPPDWEHWNAIGMAIWVASGGSEAGFTAWCTWSAKHPSHDEGACRARWHHYPTSTPTRTGAGKLFGLAAKAVPGWRPWPQPVDFLAEMDMAPPELRPDHLPEAIWGFASDIAERMGVDPVAVALGSLVSCAAVISDDWCIQPKRYDTTWVEQARLWAAIVGDPSILKSPVIAVCTKPIDRLETAARARHQEEMRDYKVAHEAWKTAEDKNGLQEPKHPKLARYLIESATIEALSEVLRDGDEAKQTAPAGKVLSRHDEMGEFFANLDRYRSGGRGGGDRGAYLRLYNGGRYTLDRVGRGTFVVPNWSACFLGGIQPGPIQRIAKDADDDGLLQRFMFCVPGRQDPGLDRTPNFAVIQRYEALFPALAALHSRSVVVLHAEAHQHREEINELARAMALMPDTSARLQAALGKCSGLFARLCLTYHLIDGADARHDGRQGPHLDVVPEATARCVASFMRDILVPHLLRGEAVMFSTAQTSHARWIAGYILAHRMDRIAARDIVRAYGALRAPEAKDELAAVMASLVTVGWLEPEMPSNPAKPISAWTINPAVHVLFADRAERERSARERTREAIAAHVEELRRRTKRSTTDA